GTVRRTTCRSSLVSTWTEARLFARELRCETLDLLKERLEVFRHLAMQGGGGPRIFLEDTAEQGATESNQFGIGVGCGVGQALRCGNQRQLAEYGAGAQPRHGDGLPV